MAELSFIDILGILGNIISGLYFISSSTKQLVLIVRRREAEGFDVLPSICMLLSTSIWTYYAITKPGILFVATINAFGAFLHLLHIIVFLIYSDDRAKAAKHFVAIDVGILGVIFLSTFFLHGDNRITVIGSFGVCSQIIVYVFPLCELIEMIRTGSVHHGALVLNMWIYFSAGIWMFYALLAQDLFLTIPNFIGVILGAARMAIFEIFWGINQHQDETHNRLIIPN